MKVLDALDEGKRLWSDPDNFTYMVDKKLIKIILNKIKEKYIMKKLMIILSVVLFSTSFISSVNGEKSPNKNTKKKPRVVVLTDAEIDDQCSMVRFLLYANDFDVEGIITTSSQYHSHGHNWAGDDWLNPYLNAYAEVYPNLVKHMTAIIRHLNT